MPIYEYRCELCGHEHEVLQKVSEPPLTDCPSCHKPGLQKVLTAAGFMLVADRILGTKEDAGGPTPLPHWTL